MASAETLSGAATSTGAQQALTAAKRGPLTGSLTAPGDKSISHRALLLGLLAIGETRITGLLESADIAATVRACRELGANVERSGSAWVIHGRGIGALRAPQEVLDFGNSGTSARLMMGALASHPVSALLTGDASLRRRPMERVLAPLREFGALAFSRDGRLPVLLEGADRPVPIVYELPVASAQVKSAVLLAALNAAGDTAVIEREPTRDHTERMLRSFGANLQIEEDSGRRTILLRGQPELKAQTIDVAGDPSSAAFPIVAALIVPESSIQVRNVLLNPTRTGLLTTLQEMGASIEIENEREVAGERVGDIAVEASVLRGVDVPPARAASMIDEYPVLAVAAAFAEGRTRMDGIAELRVKESDRIATVADGLAANGVSVRAGENYLEVDGWGPVGVAGGGAVITRADHRIAMAFLVMGLATKWPVSVDDGSMIATSYPGFVSAMRALGADIAPPSR